MILHCTQRLARRHSPCTQVVCLSSVFTLPVPHTQPLGRPLSSRSGSQEHSATLSGRRN